MNFVKEIVLVVLTLTIGCHCAPQKYYRPTTNTDVLDLQRIKGMIFTDDIVKAIDSYISRLESKGRDVYKPRNSISLRHVGFADKLAKLQVLLELNKILPMFQSVHHEQKKKFST